MDLENPPFVRARWYRKTNGRHIRLLVVHTMEYPERPAGGKWCAEYFARGSVKASAHYMVDNDSIIQGVFDRDVAYAAPGANSDGIQIEHAGYSAQGAAGWGDAYSVAMLDLSARLAAHLCVKHGIPIRHLSDAQLRAGEPGLIGHVQASRVYRLSDHGDPGPDFPWDSYINLIRHYAMNREDTMPLTDADLAKVRSIIAAELDARLTITDPFDGGKTTRLIDHVNWLRQAFWHQFGSRTHRGFGRALLDGVAAITSGKTTDEARVAAGFTDTDGAAR